MVGVFGQQNDLQQAKKNMKLKRKYRAERVNC